MTSAAEALGNQSQIDSTLQAGIEQVSTQQNVQFTQYQKVVLSADGFVFWVATAVKLQVSGSLHYATDRMQDTDQTIGANDVILTSTSSISALNAIDPMTMWIANWPIGEGIPPMRIAFSKIGPFYENAGLWHYSGFAVFAAFESQIIDSEKDLPNEPIVSNSLPIWLSYNKFAPVFPSFLVPDNIRPPYIVAHIEPGQTEALGAFPIIGPWPGDVEPNSGASPLHDLSGSQLCRDTVTLVMYGFNNQNAQQYFQYLIEASVNDELFGFGNSPAVQDEKRTQVELAALAQKKSLTIIANYYQGTANITARRLLLSASISNFAISGGLPAFGTGESTQAGQFGSGEGEVTE